MQSEKKDLYVKENDTSVDSSSSKILAMTHCIQPYINNWLNNIHIQLYINNWLNNIHGFHLWPNK